MSQPEGVGEVTPITVDQPAFGERIRSLRRELGLTQRQLAGESVSPSYVSHLESGARVPTLDVVFYLANRLGVEVSELAWGRHAPPQAQRPADHGNLVADALAGASGEPGADDGSDLPHLLAEFDRAQAADDVVATVRVGMRAQMLLRVIDDVDRRRAVLETISRVLVDARLEHQLGPVTLELATVARDAGELQIALKLVNEAETQLRSGVFDETTEPLRLHAVRLSILSDLESPDEVEAEVEKLLSEAERQLSPAVIGRVRWTASLAQARIGNRAAALRQLELAEASLNGSISVADWIRFLRAAAQVLLDVGETERAGSYIDDARRASRRLMFTEGEAQLRLLEAEYERATGDGSAALARALELLTGPDPLKGFDGQRVRWVAVEAAVQTGALPVAIEQLGLIAAEAEARGSFRSAVRALRRLNELHGLADHRAEPEPPGVAST